MRRLACLGLVSLVALAILNAPARAADKVLRMGGWEVTYDGRRATAKGPDGETIPLFPAPKPERGCEHEHRVNVLSMVGTLVSVSIDSSGYCTGAAHPYAARRYATVDLSRGGTPVSLYELFDRSAVDAAIRDDAFLKKSKDDPDADCKFTLDGFERSFAFHHVEGKKVAVRIGLTHGCEAARGGLTVLGVMLSPPDWLLAKLKLAKSRGSLMKG